MTDKPDIPKRLASKIRAVQAKVEDRCRNVSGSTFNYEQDRAELDEFEADPEGYARRRYGNHGVDSYPVQTRIGRIREKVAYHSTRGEIRLQRIKDAVAELERVEQEVLAEVASMRPSAGRVPWPKPVPAAAQLLREHRRELDQIVEKARLDREKDDAEWAEFVRQEEEENRIRREIEDAELKEMFSKMSPTARAEWKRRIQAIVDGIRTGRYGLHNIGDLINEVNK
ncbi:hypothetical protein CN934_22560 [Ensifer sp. MMN_5]|nr:hypothetical protein CN934_22560 [Ensifer sp. MMN_5]